MPVHTHSWSATFQQQFKKHGHISSVRLGVDGVLELIKDAFGVKEIDTGIDGRGDKVLRLLDIVAGLVGLLVNDDAAVLGGSILGHVDAHDGANAAVSEMCGAKLFERKVAGDCVKLSSQVVSFVLVHEQRKGLEGRTVTVENVNVFRVAFQDNISEMEETAAAMQTAHASERMAHDWKQRKRTQFQETETRGGI